MFPRDMQFSVGVTVAYLQSFTVTLPSGNFRHTLLFHDSRFQAEKLFLQKSKNAGNHAKLAGRKKIIHKSLRVVKREIFQLLVLSSPVFE